MASTLGCVTKGQQWSEIGKLDHVSTFDSISHETIESEMKGRKVLFKHFAVSRENAVIFQSQQLHYSLSMSTRQ